MHKIWVRLWSPIRIAAAAAMHDVYIRDQAWMASAHARCLGDWSVVTRSRADDLYEQRSRVDAEVISHGRQSLQGPSKSSSDFRRYPSTQRSLFCPIIDWLRSFTPGQIARIKKHSAGNALYPDRSALIKRALMNSDYTRCAERLMLNSQGVCTEDGHIIGSENVTTVSGNRHYVGVRGSELSADRPTYRSRSHQ